MATGITQIYKTSTNACYKNTDEDIIWYTYNIYMEISYLNLDCIPLKYIQMRLEMRPEILFFWKIFKILVSEILNCCNIYVYRLYFNTLELWRD